MTSPLDWLLLLIWSLVAVELVVLILWHLGVF